MPTQIGDELSPLTKAKGLFYGSSNEDSYMSKSSLDSYRLEADSMFSPPKPKQSNWLASKRFLRKERLVDRDGSFCQSKGKLSVRKKVRISDWRTMYVSDWFHSLVDMPTSRCITLLLLVYISAILFFAFPYYHISQHFNCNMGLDNFFEAFAFSLETMATIGYGAQDIFFGDCYIPIFVLCSQICSKLILDAIIIGVIFCRLSRPNSRAATILFSRCAVIQRIDNKLCLLFRVCELRKHQLVDAHIRLYAVKLHKNSSVPIDGEMDYRYFQVYPMRIHHPSDNFGSMLLLSLPQYVVHVINEDSPLNPFAQSSQFLQTLTSQPPRYPNLAPHIPSIVSPIPMKDSHFSTNGIFGSTSISSNSPLPPRFPASVMGDDEEISSGPASVAVDSPGSIYSTPFSTALNASGSMNRFGTDTFSKPSLIPTLASIDVSAASSNPSKESLMEHWTDCNLEIIAVVEGIDQTTGGAVQARHSFLTTPMNDSSSTASSQRKINGTTGWYQRSFHWVKSRVWDPILGIPNSNIPSLHVKSREGNSNSFNSDFKRDLPDLKNPEDSRGSDLGEVRWFHAFLPCVFYDDEDGCAMIDFIKFHQTYEVASDHSPV